jgi:hypothetical protein
MSKLPGDEFEFVEVAKIPFKEAFEKLLMRQVPTAQVLTALHLVKEYRETVIDKR